MGEQKPPISIHSNQSINAKVVSSAGRTVDCHSGLHDSKKDGINFVHSCILNDRTSYMRVRRYQWLFLFGTYV